MEIKFHFPELYFVKKSRNNVRKKFHRRYLTGLKLLPCNQFRTSASIYLNDFQNFWANAADY